MNLFQNLILKKEKSQNIYVNDGIIPLGYRTYNNNYYGSLELVSIPESFGSSNTIIIGTPSAGKTVLAKSIYAMKALFFADHYKRKRVIITLDSLGQEWGLCKHPNPKYAGIFQKAFGKMGKGVKNLESYSPMFAKFDAEPTDIMYGLDPADIDLRSWATLGLEKGYIIQEAVKKGNKDAQALVEYLKSLPTKREEAEAQGLEFSIHKATHTKMLNIFYYLMQDQFFGGKDTLHLSQEFLMKKINAGINLNFNFFGETQYAQIYAGIILKHIDILRRKHLIPPPCIFVEEADILCPKSKKSDEIPSARMLIKGVRRNRKHGWEIVSITQRLGSLHEDVSEFAKYFIIGGSLTVSDIRRLKELVTPQIVRVVQNLRFNPEKNIREFVLVYPDRKHYTTFRPFNCPVKTYEERRELAK